MTTPNNNNFLLSAVLPYQTYYHCDSITHPKNFRLTWLNSNVGSMPIKPSKRTSINSSVCSVLLVTDSCFQADCLFFGSCIMYHSQTSRGHTCVTCPPSLAVPHRPSTSLPFRSELEANGDVQSRPPSEVRNRWFDQLRRDNDTPHNYIHTSCWPLETSRHTWSDGDDASFLAEYALTMTTAHIE